MKLTKSAIEALEPRDQPYDVFDDEQVGLVFRLQPPSGRNAAGQRTWYYAYRVHGKRRRYRLGTFPGLSVDGARKLAKVCAGKVAAGVDPQAEREATKAQVERDKASTLRAFLDNRYEIWARSHLKTSDEQLANVRAHFSKWLDKPMAEIGIALAEDWRGAQLRKGKKATSVNRDLQRLQAALSKALEWKLLTKHPLEGLRPLKVDRRGKVRYLSNEENATLRKALVDREVQLRQARDRFNAWRRARKLRELPKREGGFVDHVRPLVLVALNTGMRRGELLALRWQHVDLEGKRITVDGSSSKTGQTRHIPLNAEILDLLKRWHEECEHTETDDLVFTVARGRKMTRVDHAWDSVMKLAGIEKFRLHDCRHHFASKLVMAGVPLNTVRELLGHTSIEMTLRYAHLAPDNLAAAVEKLGV